MDIPIFSIICAFLSKLKYLYVWLRRNIWFLAKISIKKSLIFSPINAQGENIFYLSKKSADPQNERDRFYVRIHFKFHTQYELTINNINLLYKAKKLWPTDPEIFVNDGKKKTDDSYRLAKDISIPAAAVTDIIIKRRFLCEYDGVADCGEVTMEMELIIPQLWRQFLLLTVKGMLAPGGELRDFKIVDIKPLLS